MKNILIVIDVQNDFVNGALGTPEAEEMLPRLLDKVESFDGTIILTKDTHTNSYMNTQEGKYLPVPHCIKDTEGWSFPDELQRLCDKNNYAVYQKPTFGSVNMAKDILKLYESGELKSVEFVGLCTDICVISNALLLKAYMPELPISVDASCCAGVTPQKHQAALEVMKSCQIIIK